MTNQPTYKYKPFTEMEAYTAQARSEGAIVAEELMLGDKLVTVERTGRNKEFWIDASRSLLNDRKEDHYRLIEWE